MVLLVCSEEGEIKLVSDLLEQFEPGVLETESSEFPESCYSGLVEAENLDHNFSVHFTPKEPCKLSLIILYEPIFIEILLMMMTWTGIFNVFLVIYVVLKSLLLLSGCSHNSFEWKLGIIVQGNLFIISWTIIQGDNYNFSSFEKKLKLD